MMQALVVGVLVVGAAAFVLHDLAPAWSRRLRVAIAVPLVRDGRPQWLKRVARWIAPPRPASNGCGGCSGCEPG